MIEIDRRRVHLLGVTANPNGPWVTQVARNFASDLEDAGRHFRFLIRDRHTKFTASFDAVLASVGIETIRTPVASPRANAFAERFVRTVRNDCLDLWVPETHPSRSCGYSVLMNQAAQTICSSEMGQLWTEDLSRI